MNQQFSQPKPAWRLKLSNGVGLVVLAAIVIGVLIASTYLA